MEIIVVIVVEVAAVVVVVVVVVVEVSQLIYQHLMNKATQAKRL